MGFYWRSGRSRQFLLASQSDRPGTFLATFADHALTCFVAHRCRPFGNWILVRAMAQHWVGQRRWRGLGVVIAT